jgi:hypothetical protein
MDEISRQFLWDNHKLHINNHKRDFLIGTSLRIRPSLIFNKGVIHTTSTDVYGGNMKVYYHKVHVTALRCTVTTSFLCTGLCDKLWKIIEI